MTQPTTPPRWLIILLMTFPQVVETIYSPALTGIARHFGVSEAQASQTLSIYFLAFAAGVVAWGHLCDRLGRRPAMLLGLVTYAAGALLALWAPDFDWLLLARGLAAFGAATGSVVTQTMLRDRYQGHDLAQIFSIMGGALAASPVLGLLSGGQLAEHFGHRGVFVALALLASGLLVLALWRLPETRPADVVPVAMAPLLLRMLADRSVLRSALLVALFNIMLFGYYSLAPFLFARLGLGAAEFGYSGWLLALATLAGSLLNRRWLGQGVTPDRLVRRACALACGSAIGIILLQGSAAFVLPMLGVVIAFGVAIPNVLSQALRDYRTVAGSAGALFGLGYYLLLSLGLALAGWVQSLGGVLLVCAGLALWAARRSTWNVTGR